MPQLLYETQYFTTTLNVGGGINASQTTGIIISDVSGIDTTKPGIALINYSDPLNTTLCEWIEYTSINGSKEFVGVTRGSQGFSAKTHDNSVSVAFPHSEDHNNRLANAVSKVYEPNGDTLLKATQSEVVTGTDDTKIVTPLAVYPYSNNSMSRQAIINGNFDVWQRGTSVSLVDGASTFLADRWVDIIADDGGTLPTLTRSRQALTPGELPGSFYFSRIAFNGAGSSFGVNANHYYEEKIEHGTRLLCGNGKKVTVSFWARSDVANKRLGIAFFQRYGTGGSPSATEFVVTQEPITLTSTLTKYTVTFTTNTLSGKTFGTANDDSCSFKFYYMWGTTIGNTQVYPSVTAESYVGAGYVDIAQVQICAGDVALPFMPKSYEEEKLDCERYCQISTLSGIAYDTGFLAPACSFKPAMRITPTVYTFYDGIDGTGTTNQIARLGGANADVSSLTAISISANGIGYLNKTSAFTTGGHYRGSVRVEAEL